ncbi:hypothetical protein BDR06DRAFT_1008345 [Suillus hirtellus]|nr:hypothetical protein BDR06DRAFT_1008345 [Suillus hirtellus]
MSASEPDSGALPHALTLPDLSGAVPTSSEARAKRRIAALEDELQTMKQEKGTKQRYEQAMMDNDTAEGTTEQDCLQCSYLTLAQTLPWMHSKLAELDADEAEDMLKKIKRGANVAHGNDTSTLKDLITAWVNQDFQPSSLLRSNNKHLHSFVHDICGMLLCPAE